MAEGGSETFTKHDVSGSLDHDMSDTQASAQGTDLSGISNDDIEDVVDTQDHDHEEHDGEDEDIRESIEHEHEQDKNGSMRIVLTAPAEDDNSSSLFVSERPTPHRESSVREASQVELSAYMPPPPRPETHPRPTAAVVQPKSVFGKIRAMQRKYQHKKDSANRRISVYSGAANPDDEAYLEAVMPTPAYSAGPLVEDQGGLEDRQAIAEFQKQRLYYEGLKKKSGQLSFVQDIDWLRIRGAEDARRKKRLREFAKDHEDDGDSELFPDLDAITSDGPEDESDEMPQLSNSETRKRRRNEASNERDQSMSMMDAELNSMLVAMEAGDDARKKKRKGQPNDDNPVAGPSGRGRGPRNRTASRAAKPKQLPKKVTKGGRGQAKKNREVDYAVKQATSLFNSNVFTQQAGPNATEPAMFRSRKKADALKELIASVPLGEHKKARGDMTALLKATKDFDGRGSVKSDGKGHWLLKGMQTSLKGYQVLGTAFMRRRENAAEEPKGGLMADQMGLGKTLMMLGKQTTSMIKELC